MQGSCIAALGLEVKISGGWYRASDGKAELNNLWSYQFKNTAKDIETGSNLPPPLTGRFGDDVRPRRTAAVRPLRHQRPVQGFRIH